MQWKVSRMGELPWATLSAKPQHLFCVGALTSGVVTQYSRHGSAKWTTWMYCGCSRMTRPLSTSWRGGGRRKRRWVWPWLDMGRRVQFGRYHCLMPELTQRSLIFLKLPGSTTRHVWGALCHRGPRCTKQDTQYRKATQPGLKTAMTMNHLASGDSYASMKFWLQCSS